MGDELIDIGLTFMLRMLKDPKRTKGWRKQMLKVLRAIAAAYANDDEFMLVMKSWSVQPK